MSDEILSKLREFAAANSIRIFILARNPRLRFRLEGDEVRYGSGFSDKLEKAIGQPNLTVLCTSGGQGSMNFSVWTTDAKGELQNPWQEAADKRKEEARKSGRSFPKSNLSNCPFPHCDSRVLHKPGTCEYCDQFPVYQYYREALGINFTGGTDIELLPCPAEVERPIETIERWGGNVAMTTAQRIEADRAWKVEMDKLLKERGIEGQHD